MPHDVRQWPGTVYPGEVDQECSEAKEDVDVLIRELRAQGPSPAGYEVKNLGKPKNGLWQLNLKVNKRQIRFLYAPYGNTIVLFRIHKKGSPQEQQRAYKLAMTRKDQYEAKQKEEETRKRKTERSNGGSRTPN
jgi:hypothetical protein